MTIYKAGLLSTVFSHVIKTIEKEYLDKIFILYAGRRFMKETQKSKLLLPYLRYRERTSREIEVIKRSETSIIHPEWKQIINTIRDGGFGDITVTSLGFLIRNTHLREIIEKSLKRKIAPTRFVFLFKNNTQSAKESGIKEDLLKIMRDYAEKLGLKYATLELSGIYTLQDWRSEKKFNLLTTNKINVDKETVSEIIETFFKPTIQINGQETKIRFVKWYEFGKGRVLKFGGFEKI